MLAKKLEGKIRRGGGRSGCRENSGERIHSSMKGVKRGKERRYAGAREDYQKRPDLGSRKEGYKWYAFLSIRNLRREERTA